MKIKTLICTCGACPEQYEGETKDGKEIYVRIRWGHARVDIDGVTVAEKSYDDSYKGIFEGKELKALLKAAGLKGIKKIFG